MTFDILIGAVGPLRTSYVREACDEYLKRIAPFARVKIEEIKQSPFRNTTQREKAKREEGERILRFVDSHRGRSAVLLDERGEEYTSEKFAAFLEKEISLPVFIVGGTLGFSEDVTKRNFPRISLSRFTFPHEVARLLLLEQIYRASAIANGKEYHY